MCVSSPFCDGRREIEVAALPHAPVAREAPRGHVDALAVRNIALRRFLRPRGSGDTREQRAAGKFRHDVHGAHLSVDP